MAAGTAAATCLSHQKGRTVYRALQAISVIVDGTTIVLDTEIRYRASDPLVQQYPELFVEVFETTSADPGDLR